jgi:hypothetical protein
MLEDLQIMLSVCVKCRRQELVKEGEIVSEGVTPSDQHLEWKNSAGEQKKQTRSNLYVKAYSNRHGNIKKRHVACLQG